MTIVCMLLSMLPVTFFANPDTETDSTTELELEIPEDAIWLSTPEDILAFVNDCRVNTWSVGKTVVLKNDIDMSGVEFAGIPTFGGIFLGQGYKISGIEMKHDGSVAGFFRYLQKTAIVEGLSITGNYIFDGSHTAIGGFVGNNAGRIYNCSFEGVVTGAQQIGGIAGINETTGLIENCTVAGTVYGNHFIGGIVGENKGIVRTCTNQAELNTQSVQNSVDLEDITLDSFINTENAGTITDIGGISGGNSGVIRGCINKGLIGYEKMGYNIGGIAGTQNGYIVDCENHAKVQGRKEVGGIVGHTEPNILLKYDADSLQILNEQMDGLNASMNQLEGVIQSDSEELAGQIEGMGTEVDAANEALDILLDAMNIENGEVDEDQVIAAASTLSDALKALYDKSVSIQGNINDSNKENSKVLDGIVGQLEGIVGTVEHADENFNLSITDVSGDDTETDTLGKIANCVNYGDIAGDFNIGGIAGILAEENDLDQYQDTEIVGNASLNATYQIRVVVRGCVNHGTVVASKQYAGGITGQMIIGAVLECTNLGALNAIHADYVGGIVGSSAGILRDSSAKCLISGDSYVGGIAGKGKEVTGCYAFVDMKYFVEKAGGIVGITDELPDGTDDVIVGNYYYNAGKEAGGIDGITYIGATDSVDVATFLQLPNLSELLHTVGVRFLVEGQEDVVFTLNVGDSLTMEQLPKLSIEANSEYEWELIPAVDAEILEMGETASVEYLSEDSITNILFDQTYQVAFDLKDTVISSTQRNEKNLSVALAEGVFAKNTTLDLVENSSLSEVVDLSGKSMKDIVERWSVILSNSGVSKLHYLIPENIEVENMKLYVQDSSGAWVQRQYVVEGSYLVFDFVDGEVGFALQVNTGGINWSVVMIAVASSVLFGIIRSIMKWKKA